MAEEYIRYCDAFLSDWDGPRTVFPVEEVQESSAPRGNTNSECQGLSHQLASLNTLLQQIMNKQVELTNYQVELEKALKGVYPKMDSMLKKLDNVLEIQELSEDGSTSDSDSEYSSEAEDGMLRRLDDVLDGQELSEDGDTSDSGSAYGSEGDDWDKFNPFEPSYLDDF